MILGKTHNKPMNRAQHQLRYASSNNPSNMMRASSVGVLNQQSESESELGGNYNPMAPPKAAPRSNLMRPTISSQNKIANVPKTNLRRRTIQSSYSTGK